MSRRSERFVENHKRLAAQNANGLVTSFVGAGDIESNSWLFGRLRGRLRRQEKPADPATLPLAPAPETSAGHVRIAQPPTEP